MAGEPLSGSAGHAFDYTLRARRSEVDHDILVKAASVEAKADRLAGLLAVDPCTHGDLIVAGRQLYRIRHSTIFPMELERGARRRRNHRLQRKVHRIVDRDALAIGV